MKKKLLLLLVLSVPVILYFNVWQALRFHNVETEIDLLENKQDEWIEANKKVIIGIEVLGAPSRINDLANDMENMSRREFPAAIRIKIDGAKGASSG